MFIILYKNIIPRAFLQSSNTYTKKNTTFLRKIFFTIQFDEQVIHHTLYRIFEEFVDGLISKFTLEIWTSLFNITIKNNNT